MKNSHLAVGTLMAAAAAALVAGAPRTSYAAAWIGTGGLGGDGEWNASADWSPNALPIASDTVSIAGSASTAQIAVSKTAEVPTGAATSDVMTINYGKSATISLADDTSLTIGSQLNTVYDPSKSGAQVTFAGPATGSATLSIGRIYIVREHTSADIVTLTGSHLTASVGSNAYSNITSGNALVVTGGATLNSSDEIYIRQPSSNGLVSRMTIDNGVVTVTNIRVYDGQLLQLSANGTLSAGNIYMGTSTGGDNTRFEAAGTGLTTSGTLRIYGGNTLAVGLTDLNTHTRTAVASLTLHSTFFDPGGIVQFGIFSDTSADQINIASGSSLTSYGAGVKLELTPYNFTPHAGDVYTLFTGNTAGITAPFDTSGVDTNLWDLTKFNQAGGWKVSVVPEPASLALLGLGGLLLIRRRK